MDKLLVSLFAGVALVGYSYGNIEASPYKYGLPLETTVAQVKSILPEEYRQMRLEQLSGVEPKKVMNRETRQKFINEYFCEGEDCSNGKKGMEPILTGQYLFLIKYLDCGDSKKPISLNDTKTRILYFYADDRFQKVVENKIIKNPALQPQNQSCEKRI